MPVKVAKGRLVGGKVLVSDEKEANSLYQKGFFGDMGKGGKLTLSLVEAMFLVEKDRLAVKEGRKKVAFEQLMELARDVDSTVSEQYAAYSDLRERGYVVKTGFKFGAHFRVYERGSVPGEEHSDFMIHAVPEYYEFTMTEFSRIVRLAHSVKKKFWLAVVDNEGDITYYETKRVKP